ncbi:MAG: GtrA family protein [Rhodoferax sp.]|nr:GtrA family protein [Rhodoferax sp.]MDP3652861.1 GtrA family protein [Rhodoferax sp.]
MDIYMHLTRYAVVGLFSNAFVYAIYLALTHFGLDPKLAMSLVYCIGVLQTFVFNKAWTFQFSGTTAPAFARYAAIYAVGYLINIFVIILLVERADLPHQWVMAGLILFMAVFFFMGQKFWVFRHDSRARRDETGLAVHMHLQRWLFGTYSFIENLLRIVLELFPQPLRYWVFKAMLGRLGHHSMIDYQTYFRYPWKIRIGDGVWINRGCEFYASMLAGSAHITIGDHSALGPRVRVLSATHNYRYLTLPDQATSVTIGHHVWIGAGATILPGVRIGDGAVVAASSVVTHDVAPFCIVAGNPARFIKTRELDNASSIQ